MSSKHHIIAYFPFADSLMACEIDYSFIKGSPAVMYLSNGDPGHPGDPDEVEFINAECIEDGVTLPENWQKCLRDWAAEYIISEGYDAAVERAYDDIAHQRARAAEYRAELLKEDNR